MFISPASQKPEKMNQSESRIQKETTNYNHHNNWHSYINPWLIPSSIFPNSYDVLLWEMRQRIYWEEKSDQASKDPSVVNRGLYLWCMWKRFWQRRCQKQTYEDPPEGFKGVWADLFLWGMRQRVQPIWHQKEAWSSPQLQLDLRSMRSVFQQTGHPSTSSCPARETRGQAETTDEETSSTWTRTRDEASTYHVTTTEFQPTRRFYLTIPRPEHCIDNIGSPSVQRKHPATISKTGTTLS